MFQLLARFGREVRYRARLKPYDPPIVVVQAIGSLQYARSGTGALDLPFHYIDFREVLMLHRFFIAIVACCSLLQAQESSTPEPQYGHQYNAFVGDQLVVLERQTAVTDTKSRHWVLIPSTSVFESINHPASPVRVGPGTHFLVRMATSDRDPQTLIHLQKLTPGKKDRQVPIVTYKVSLIPGGGVNHKRSPDEPISVKIQKYGVASLEIIPQQPLEPGEYAFMSGHEAQCFGVDASLTSSEPPPALSKPHAPPPPKVWKIDTLGQLNNSGQEVMQSAAILEGQSIVNGTKADSYLVMHCGFPVTDYPDLLPLEVILGGTDEMLNVPGAPGTFLDITDFASSQLGAANPIGINANGQNRSNGARIRFFYDALDMQQIVDATGQTLKLSLGWGSPSAAGPVATFNLPSNNASVKQMMGACLAKSANEAEALKARTVASCPTPKEGNVLDSVVLKYADNGRELKGEMDEEDAGGSWKLPAIAKGRPVHKVLMTCSYRNAGASEGAAVIEKSTVPLPPTARSCTFMVHKNVLRNDGACFSAVSKQIATTRNKR